MQDMLNRHVALKILLPNMMKNENLRKSFLSEGKIITSLDHPNIVRIHDIGIVDETTFYMSMEYLSGGTFKEKMTEGELVFSEAQHILEEIAKGLAYAHDKSYIHCQYGDSYFHTACNLNDDQVLHLKQLLL